MRTLCIFSQPNTISLSGYALLACFICLLADRCLGSFPLLALVDTVAAMWMLVLQSLHVCVFCRTGGEVLGHLVTLWLDFEDVLKCFPEFLQWIQCLKINKKSNKSTVPGIPHALVRQTHSWVLLNSMLARFCPQGLQASSSATRFLCSDRSSFLYWVWDPAACFLLPLSQSLSSVKGHTLKSLFGLKMRDQELCDCPLRTVSTLKS